MPEADGQRRSWASSLWTTSFLAKPKARSLEQERVFQVYEETHEVSRRWSWGNSKGSLKNSGHEFDSGVGIWLDTFLVLMSTKYALFLQTLNPSDSSKQPLTLHPCCPFSYCFTLYKCALCIFAYRLPLLHPILRTMPGRQLMRKGDHKEHFPPPSRRVC